MEFLVLSEIKIKNRAGMNIPERGKTYEMAKDHFILN